MSIVQAYTEAYRNYLFDESRTMGRADYIAFPRNEAELVEAVRFAHDNHVPLTAQGARTGLAGGASPQGGMILNLSRMNRILGIRRDEEGRFLLRVQPGVALTTVRKALKNKSFDVSGWDEESRETLKDVRAGALFFSPDPTEPTASIGGMASCNACGARSFLYGCTRKHVNALRAVLADGRVTELMRGRERARGRDFELPCTDGSVVRGRLPDFDTPDIKDAGYLLRADMELIDLFLGSQGTLGVISELELILLPSPALLCGVTAFFPDDENALQYVYAMKKFDPKPASIEFFDKRALDLVEAQKAETPAFRQLQPLPENYCCAVYVEFNLDDKDGLCPVLEKLAPVIAQQRRRRGQHLGGARRTGAGKAAFVPPLRAGDDRHPRGKEQEKRAGDHHPFHGHGRGRCALRRAVPPLQARSGSKRAALPHLRPHRRKPRAPERAGAQFGRVPPRTRAV